MPTIDDVIASETFSQRTTDAIVYSLIDCSGTAYDSAEGFIEGRVTAFTIEDGPKFDSPSGEGASWTAAFTGTGEATIGYKTPDGEYRNAEISGPFAGLIQITLPLDVSASATAEAVAEATEISIEIESASLKDEDPDR